MGMQVVVRGVLPLLLCVLELRLCGAAPSMVVDVRGAAQQVQLPVLVCAGLFNRLQPRAYVVVDDKDVSWPRVSGHLPAELRFTTVY